MLAGGSLVWVRAGLLALAFSIAVGLLALYANLWAHRGRGWAVELPFLAAGLFLVIGAAYGRSLGVRWATEILALAGGLLPIIVAFISASEVTSRSRSSAASSRRRHLRWPLCAAVPVMHSPAALGCLRSCSTSSSVISGAASGSR